MVEEHIYPAFLHTLLAIPNLTGRLPLASLSTLISGLHLWDKLVPLAASKSGLALLKGTNLATEIGKTNLLANLSTIAVRTGMVAKKDTDSIAQWMHFLSILLEEVEPGWGLWIQRQGTWSDEEEVQLSSETGRLDADVRMESDSDEDRDNGVAGGNKRLQEALIVARNKSRLRGRVDPATTSRLLHLFSTQHLNILVGKSLETDATIQEFTKLIITMLQVFRGSARWEEILDCILESGSGVQLQRQLWLKAKGTWTNTSRSEWANLYTTSPSEKTSQLPILQLFSVLYLQNLLTLPDDEFFQPVRKDGSRSALTVDEVADLAGIWRDLAFWGYTVGNGPETALTRRKEEFRSLMTQGVLAVSARK
jgi:ubiquitin-protein ligase E3 C